MYPTKCVGTMRGKKEPATAVRTAVELANATGSELHVAHAISTAPQSPYPRHYERAKSEDILQRKRVAALVLLDEKVRQAETDRKGTRLNSSHANISYAVFCLKNTA